MAVKSCASRDTVVDSDEAIEIARDEVDWEPDRVLVRFIPRGVQSRPYWAVSLSMLDGEENLVRLAVVLVNARTGEVEEVDVRGR